MRPVIKNSILITALFLSVGLAAQTPATKLTPTPVQKLRSNTNSVQYALGAYLAQWAITNGFSIVDAAVFLTGMEDMFNKKIRLVKDSSLTPLLTAFQKEDQLKRGKNLELQLFASLKDKPGIGRLPNGVQYSVIKPGRGARPAETDSVVINFKGRLADGTVFEDTYARNINFTLTPSMLIPGLLETIQLMPLGAAWEIYIPAPLAYAEKGNGALIPPNSALIIVIELLEIKGKK